METVVLETWFLQVAELDVVLTLGATLVFDVELIGIRGKGKYANK